MFQLCYTRIQVWAPSSYLWLACLLDYAPIIFGATRSFGMLFSIAAYSLCIFTDVFVQQEDVQQFFSSSVLFSEFRVSENGGLHRYYSWP